MKQKHRLFVTFSLYWWATAGLFFLGTFWLYLLPLGGVIYTIVGGQKHA